MCLISEESEKNQVIYDWRSFDFGSKKEISFKNQFLINSIANECLKDFENLELFEIDSTHIININTYTFQHLNKLKTLNLGYNRIEQIDTIGFQGLVNLIELNLSHKRRKEVMEFFAPSENIYLIIGEQTGDIIYFVGIGSSWRS